MGAASRSGSYARRELCPGSDVDVMLLHAGGRRERTPTADDAGALWYPLWDAGFVLGQSVRTVKEALALADDDLDALTALLDVRLVAGDATLADELDRRVRELAPRRRDGCSVQLAGRARRGVWRGRADRRDARAQPEGGRRRPARPAGARMGRLGPRTGAETEAPCSTGRAGTPASTAGRPWLPPTRATRAGCATPATRLLDARVALHRVTGGRSDRLAAAGAGRGRRARRRGATPTRSCATLARRRGRGRVDHPRPLVPVARDAEAGPGGAARRESRPRRRRRAARRPGRVRCPTPRSTRPRAARRRRTRREPECRSSGRRSRASPSATNVEWDADARDAFIDLLAAGPRAIPVFEALDHVGVLVRLLPEWEHVRARPQRNAYHRFTVDRHSLEAVAECAALLDPDDRSGAGFDGDVARARAGATCCCSARLLHDIGKGRPGDHSEVGAAIAP